MSSAATPTRDAIPVREFFCFDLRSLALFRVLLGIMLLVDTVDRLGDVRAFYSDDGILPRTAITGTQPMSIHHLFGGEWWPTSLLLVNMVFALMVVVGWRTSVAVFICWFLQISIQARFPPAMQGGDQMFRMMLFWSIFLPLGAFWSIDAARRGTPAPRKDVISPASVAYVAQILLIYWFAAAWKWADAWHTEGTAVFMAVQVDFFTTRLGFRLLEHPWLCELMTHGTIYLEALGPLLLLLPFNVPLQRLFAILSFILFHAGLALTIELGTFPFVCMLLWLPLVPSAFWDRIPEIDKVRFFTRFQATGEPSGAAEPRGVFANLIVIAVLLWVISYNVISFLDFRLPKAYPELAAKILPVVPNSYLTMGMIPGFDQGWGLFAPAPARTGGWYKIHGTTADGKVIDLEQNGAPADFDKPEFVSPTFGSFRWRRTRQCFLLKEAHPNILPGYARWRLNEWNREHPEQPITSVEIYWMLSLTQPPGVPRGVPTKLALIRYEPAKAKPPGWLLVSGTTANGQQLELMRDSMVISWDNPQEVRKVKPSNPWFPHLANIMLGDANAYVMPGFARYLLEEWNRSEKNPERKLVKVELWRMADVNAEAPEKTEKELLGSAEVSKK
jgi:hypothetical protein